MKKSATAGTHFNARVVECRLAAKVCLRYVQFNRGCDRDQITFSYQQVLANVSGLDWRSVRRLSEVQEGKKKSLNEM